MGQIFFDDSPPKPGPDLPILRVKGSTPVRYLLLGSKLLMVWTHYTKSGTQPCIRPRTECKWCQTTRNRRWKAYIHALRMRSNEEGFLELTPGGVAALQSQHGSIVNLRGLQITGARGEGEKTRQKIDCVYALPSTKGFVMPEEKSPMITLNEMWGLAAIALHVPTEEGVDDFKEMA